jgi:diphosphate-dependent phosphofructokinase
MVYKYLNGLINVLLEVMMESLDAISPFQVQRLEYRPLLPDILKEIFNLKANPSEVFNVDNEVSGHFPHLCKLPAIRFERSKASHTLANASSLRVGIVFSGGQAPGGNNVISGVFDALQSLSDQNILIGFLGGPAGLIEGRSKVLTAEILENYRNLGGFDLLGSDRTKLEAQTQATVLRNVQALDLDGLIIIGGDDSNTNAAFLAEYFVAQGVKTRVIGVPKTIDGDLKSHEIETSFGFDTATKVYSDIIGNLARDALSAKKYYFFVKLMGRTASSIALECALQTHPNCTLIGEEIAAEGKNLADIITHLTDLICERSKLSKDYGVILIPEGLLEFIPDCRQMIQELGAQTAAENLSSEARACFSSLPETIRQQLMLDRDPHGNLQVSKIETERLLIDMIQAELEKRKASGTYKGKFNPQPLFCGYEGRSCAPSNFDANYCYALGHVAAALIHNGFTGYMAAVQKLAHSVEQWQPAGIPLLYMMGFEERKGKRKIVIRKALVNLEGHPFITFKEKRSSWALHDDYRYPGAIQYFGPEEVSDRITLTLALEQANVLIGVNK